LIYGDFETKKIYAEIKDFLGIYSLKCLYNI